MPVARRRTRSFAVRHQLSWRYRYAHGAILDLLDVARGAGDPGIPPKRLQPFVGDGDFRAIGEEFVSLAQDIGGLAPDGHLLDIGAGFGRMAIPLTRYLSTDGSYDGIEIMRRAVRWCTSRITPAYPSFRFHHIDAYNRLYNPKGKVPAESVQFPFGEHAFDFVLLASVFTHMLPATAEHYLEEIARVITDSGAALATAFLLDDVSSSGIDAGVSRFAFAHQAAPRGVMTTNPVVPEAAVAYPRSYFEELVVSSGLVVDKLYPGRWSGRSDGLSTQDVLLLKLN